MYIYITIIITILESLIILRLRVVNDEEDHEDQGNLLQLEGRPDQVISLLLPLTLDAHMAALPVILLDYINIFTFRLR